MLRPSDELTLPVRYCQFFLSEKFRTRIYGLTINAICQTLGITKFPVREYHTHVINQQPSQYAMNNSKWFIPQFVIKTRNKNQHVNHLSLGLCSHICVCVFLTFRHRASSILGQAFRYYPENAFYIFNQQIYFIIWYLLDRASLIKII